MYSTQYISNIMTLYNNAKNNGSISDRNKYRDLLNKILSNHNKTK